MKKLLLSFISLLSLNAFAQNAGDLDTAFGIGGKVITNQWEAPYTAVAQVMQPDGKIVIIGTHDLQSGFIIRINTDGSIDNSFNSGAILHLDDATEFATVALQSDGKIIIGGSVYNNYSVVARLNANGTVDNSFGIGGYAVNNYSPESYWHTVNLKVLSNDKIVSVNKDIFLDPNQFEVVMYDADGNLDSSFSGDGILPVTTANINLYPKQIMIQSDGKLVISGNYSTNGGVTVNNSFLTRLNADGTYDVNFNSGSTKLIANDKMNSFAIQNDGKILLSCSSSTTTKLLRYNTDGSTDSNFNATGAIFRNIPYFGNYYAGDNYSTVKVQTDNKIVVVTGYNSGFATVNGKNNDIAVLRFNSNGTIDNTFDIDGMLLVSFYSLNDFGISFDIYNNKYIISGNTFQSLFEKRIVICSVNADATFDTTFDTDGKNTILPARGSIDIFVDSDIQADDKVIMVSDCYTANNDIGDFYFPCFSRYNSNGSLDTTYGTAGRTLINPNTGKALAVKLQPDGKLLVSLTANTTGTRILRLNTNGSIDNTFGTNGYATLSNQSFGEIRCITLQSDGKIVLAGKKTNSVTSSSQNVFLARLNTNGSFDTTFGTGGSTTLGATAVQDYLRFAKVQPDGKIVAAGSFYNGTATDIAVLRYNSNGTLDTTFNGNGFFSMDGGSTGNDFVRGMDIQSDGKIIGAVTNGSGAFLFRVTASGSIDTGFFVNNDGLAPVGGPNVSALKLLPDQKIMICGTFSSPSDDNFFVSRHKPDGFQDQSFAGSGALLTNINVDDEAGNLLFTNDFSKVVVTGDSSTYRNTTALIADLSMTKYYLYDQLSTPENRVSHFLFYPNPATNTVHFDENISSINLYSIEGKKIESNLLNNIIDVSGLSNGIYLLQMSDENGKSQTQKLIKE